MKKVFGIFTLSMLLTLVLAACGPKATPAPATAVPAAEVVTEAPIQEVMPVAGSDSTPTPVPIDLAGPKMEVGSTFLYVDGTTIVAVPGGEFIMGRKGGTDNPEHKVTLADFWIYSTEVTNEQYKTCVASGQCSEPDLNDNLGYNDYERTGEPVSGVNWAQASAYCMFVHARLPTEAEWEKTARGPDANIYPWGDAAPTCNLLNFNDCINKTTRVYQYPDGASYYKALDMAGNVYEWVSDWYDPFYYKNSPLENPLGPGNAQKRSVRSSAYDSNADQVPASVRYFNLPEEHSRNLGFRCVVEDPQYFAPYCQTALVTGLGPNGRPLLGGTSRPSCPALGISITSLCNFAASPAIPYTNVEVPPYLDPYTDYGSCTLDHDNIYVCLTETDVTIDTAEGCTYTPPSPPSCPAGYQQNGNLCQPSKIRAGQCLPGLTYDSVNQCCAGTPGQAASLSLPAGCPAGFSYDPITNACNAFAMPPVSEFPISLEGCIPPEQRVHEDPGNPGQPGDPGSGQPANPGGGCVTTCRKLPNGGEVCTCQ
jgi:formylglycine-generating enzyme required for sulfatase activity